MLEFYIFTKGQSECYESTLISRNELINKIPELACSEPRDLSILDNTSKISHIAIRSKCYVLKLDFIRAIITKDKLYILKIIKNDFVESLKINLHKYQEQNGIECFITKIPPKLAKVVMQRGSKIKCRNHFDIFAMV